MKRNRKGLLYSTLFLAFLLGSYNGYVALWQSGCPEPAEIYPYPVSLLPPADQAALEQGIPAADSLELAQLLEDYLS